MHRMDDTLTGCPGDGGKISGKRDSMFDGNFTFIKFKPFGTIKNTTR